MEAAEALESLSNELLRPHDGPGAMRSERLLGPHGAWAVLRAEEFIRQGLQRLGRFQGADADGLAKANSE